MDAVRSLAKAIPLLFVLSTLSANAFAQIAPRLVADINALGSGAPLDSRPRDFVDQGTWSYFVAVNGNAFKSWGTDGTTGGTNHLGALAPLPGNFTGAQFVQAGSESFLVTGSNNDSALWALDGTPEGTRLVTSIPASVSLAGALGNQLILRVFTSRNGWEVWRSDGTGAGTQPIRGAPGGSLEPFIFVDGKFFFMAQSGPTREAWVSDSTEAGTRRLATFETDLGLRSNLFLAGRSVLFLAEQPGTDIPAMWRIDIDTEIVSVLISDIGFSDIEAPRELGDVTLFRATMQSDNSGQVWRSDGTMQGTFRIPGVAPRQDPEEAFFGPLPTGLLVYVAHEGNGNPHRLWATDGTTASPITTAQAGAVEQIGGLVYFQTGFGVWRSDGTQAGTRKLTGVPDLTVPNANFMLAGDATRLFVRRNQGALGQGTTEIYRYDLGTDTAATLRTSTLTDDARIFSVARGLLYFDSYDAQTGNEPWISDGTVQGTRLLRNIAPETNSRSSSPSNFAQLDNRLYFVADEGITGRELWRTNGSPFHTVQVVDANPGPGSSDPEDIFAANGQVFFFAKDATGEYKFWRSDGTTGGTRALATISPVSQAPSRLLRTCGSLGVGAGGNVYFPAFDDIRGIELWRTDGTSSGTAPYDINGGAADSSPCWLTEEGGNLYFTAEGGPAQGDIEVWKVDGASMQPSRVTNVSPAPTPGEPDVWPANLTSFNGAVYFGWIDGSRNAQLLRLNPATGALSVVVQFPADLRVAVSDIAVLNSSAFLFVRRPTGELWRSDGTPAGTARIGNVTVDGELLVHGGRAYFSGTDVAPPDAEPWVSDGTDAGTRLIREIKAGPSGSRPEIFTPFSGVTLFQIRDQTGANAPQLWQTNGTHAGTFKLVDLSPTTPPFIPPRRPLSAGQHFYFVADDGASGLELFAIDDGPPLATSDSFTVSAGASLVMSVLVNDFDVGGTVDRASVRIEAAPLRGTVSGGASGQITYNAPTGFAGADPFTYSVADDDGHRTAPVDVNVRVDTAGPPPPVPPPGGAGGGGGGGSLGGGVVATLLLLFAFRRSARAPSWTVETLSRLLQDALSKPSATIGEIFAGSGQGSPSRHPFRRRSLQGWIRGVFERASWSRRLGGATHYCMCCPPLIAMLAPVTNAASSEHR